MTVERTTSNKIVVLSMLAAWMVVLIHSSYGLDMGKLSSRVYLTVFQSGICGFAVPFFFIVSGMFFVKNYQSADLGWWRKEVKKRIRTLLVPYFAWAGLAVIDKVLRGGGVSWLADFGITTVTPHNGSLWYIKVLFLVCVVSPLLIIFVRKIVRFNRTSLLWLALGAGLLGLPLPGVKTYYRAVFYFMFGVWVALGGVSVLSKLNRVSVRIALFCIWIAANVLCLLVPFHNFWLHIPVVTVPLAWVAFQLLYDKFEGVRNVCDADWFRSICRTSFFVYCSHEILRHCFCLSKYECTVWGVVLSGTVVFVVSVTLAIVLRRTMPKAYGVLMGGRVS